MQNNEEWSYRINEKIRILKNRVENLSMLKELNVEGVVLKHILNNK